MHIYMYKPFWTHIKRGQGPIKKPYKHALGGGANSSDVHCNKKPYTSMP